MSQVYSKDPLVDRSLRHSVRDAAAYSVMAGSGETYLSAFALFLRASTAQIGLLASLPPLVASMAQLGSALLARRTGRRKVIIVAGAVAQAMVWPMIALLPLLFPAHAVPLLIGCAMAYYAAGNLILPQWSSLMGDLVPERRRGRFFARRTRVASLVSFSAVVAAGLVLQLFQQRGAVLGGFMLLFGVAALARGVSAWHLAHMHEPPGRPALMEALTDRGWLARVRRSPFVHFSLFVAGMQFAVGIAGPFFTVYMLRHLHFSYAEFMTATAASVLVQVMTLNAWGRVGDAFGNRLVLLVSASMIPFIPLLWMVSTNFTYLIGVQLVGGLAWAGFSLAAGNFVYDLMPVPRRTSQLALHNMLGNLGLFVGALIGGYLGEALPREFALAGIHVSWTTPLLGLFLLSALARAAVALLFLPRLREVRPVRPVTLGGLVFRVTRFHALSGLIFDIVGPRSRPAAQRSEGRPEPPP